MSTYAYYLNTTFKIHYFKVFIYYKHSLMLLATNVGGIVLQTKPHIQNPLLSNLTPAQSCSYRNCPNLFTQHMFLQCVWVILLTLYLYAMFKCYMLSYKYIYRTRERAWKSTGVTHNINAKLPSRYLSVEFRFGWFDLNKMCNFAEFN